MSDVRLPSDDQFPPVKILSKSQRRVLGVLIEKGITTPEYYPLTLKALTTGCNQKNNRSPIAEYSEEDVLRAVDQLRELGLAAVVHTESGRSERYRHYARKRFPFSESQLAIMTELWLRGRQTLGDLRVRASRMQDIPTLEQLREDLKSLQEYGYIQANGPLEVRGVEVDHSFYKPDEGKTLAAAEWQESNSPGDDVGSGIFRKNESVPVNTVSPSVGGAHVIKLEEAIAAVQAANSELVERVKNTEQALSQLTERFEALRRELGASV